MLDVEIFMHQHVLAMEESHKVAAYARWVDVRMLGRAVDVQEGS
jgi:hypothetical protein